MAIERKFVAQSLKEFRIKEYVEQSLSRVGLSDIKLQRTPLGDKILIKASRPGLVVGRGGSNIQRLTEELKNNFNLENPQIEIEEVENFGLDPNVVAEMIVNSLERFGSGRFKGVGHRALSDVMQAGALGVEIIISGKVPSSRGKSWRFYQGYLKKCGNVAVVGVDIAYKTAVLKTGAVGVKVSIMPPTTVLPDRIDLHEATIEEVVEPEVNEEMKKVIEAASEGTKKDEAEPAKKAKKSEKKVEEAKPEVAPEPQPEVKAESKSEPNPEVKAEVKAESKVKAEKTTKKATEKPVEKPAEEVVAQPETKPESKE